jgi:thiamine-monophosphate kinase
MTSSNSDRPHRLNEFAMIAKYFAPLSKGAAGAAGLTDDVATLNVPAGHEMVAKVDAVVEGVHFLRHDPASLVASKALRVNLSDLAAKGATPIGYLLSLSLASWADDDWIAQFAEGLREDQNHFGVDLLGGDTTSTPGPVTISITALGSILAGTTVRRAGAQPGDLVFVTGSIGDAGAGLAVLKGEGTDLPASERETLIRRYRVPEPRLAVGRLLPGLASASLDVSDGLIADLGHIAETSAVRLVVEAARVPLSSAVRALWGDGIDGIVRCVTVGDDYEIAFTAPAQARSRIADVAARSRIPVTEIGTVEAGQGVTLLDRGEPVPINRPGYTHF